MPRAKRPLANAIFHGGTSIGAICTPLVVAVLIRTEADDWRPVFQLVGGVGAVWVVAWLWFVRGDRAAELDHVPPEEAPANPTRALVALAGNRKFWIAVTVGVTVNVCWHLYRIFLVR